MTDLNLTGLKDPPHLVVKYHLEKASTPRETLTSTLVEEKFTSVVRLKAVPYC